MEGFGAYVLKNVDRLTLWPGFGVETTGLLNLYRTASRRGGDSFLSAVRSRVLQKFEETPDFPPRDLFEDNADEMDEMDWESPDPVGRPGNTEASDEAVVGFTPLLETDADRERTQEWARITSQNILDAEDLWETWSWCRMALVSVQNGQNTPEIDRFITSEGFREYWKIVEEPEKGPGRRTVLSTQPFSELLSKRPVRSQINFFLSFCFLFCHYFALSFTEPY